MPRKPKLGPPVIVLEGLSDGRALVDGLMDDFTGQPIKPNAHRGPSKYIRPAAEVLNERKRQRIAEQRQMLERVGILPSPVKDTIAQGQPKGIRLGAGHVMVLPKRPFRRV